MADLREQINSARRAGYSDSDIAGFLKQRDPNISKALESGYSAEEVMQHLAPPPTVMERAVRQTGIAARGAAPGALGATAGGALGAAIGGPPGAAVGALAGSLYVPAADALASAYRGITGRDVKPLSQAISERLPGPRAADRCRAAHGANGRGRRRHRPRSEPRTVDANVRRPRFRRCGTRHRRGHWKPIDRLGCWRCNCSTAVALPCE